MDNIKLEILNYSYWEHFKLAKDLALILPLDHPRRQLLEKEMTDLLKQIHQIKNKFIK